MIESELLLPTQLYGLGGRRQGRWHLTARRVEQRTAAQARRPRPATVESQSCLLEHVEQSSRVLESAHANKCLDEFREERGSSWFEWRSERDRAYHRL
jgi:hypothetical protein